MVFQVLMVNLEKMQNRLHLQRFRLVVFNVLLAILVHLALLALLDHKV
jgi:hypothetical protein